MPYWRGHSVSMWTLIPLKGMLPTRLARYCCGVLKEQSHDHSFICTGVRWAESVSRQKRGILETVQSKQSNKLIINNVNLSDSVMLENDNDDKRLLFETCQLKAKRVVNPIIDWTDAEVWDYINSEHIPVNPLYKEGFCRIGCIGCPNAGTKGRYEQFARWPKYKNLYMMAIKNMLERQKEKGLNPPITDPEEVFHWWMEDGILPGQTSMFDNSDSADDDE